MPLKTDSTDHIEARNEGSWDSLFVAIDVEDRIIDKPAPENYGTMGTQRSRQWLLDLRIITENKLKTHWEV